MTRTIAIALIGAAVVLGTAYYANSQQLDGTNCEWAYKKLQQHRNYGVCNEDSSRSDNTPADNKVERPEPKGFERSISRSGM